jgi:putative aldouronate transport system substrate-binding protein
MLLLSDDFTLVSPAIAQHWRDRAMSQYKQKESLSDETTIALTDYDLYFYDSPAMRRAVFDMPKEYAELVLMEGDIEANWNNWVAEKMQVVQPVIDELNAL